MPESPLQRSCDDRGARDRLESRQRMDGGERGPKTSGNLQKLKREADGNTLAGSRITYALARCKAGAGLESKHQGPLGRTASPYERFRPCFLTLEIATLAEASKSHGSGRGALPNQEPFSDQCQWGKTR